MNLNRPRHAAARHTLGMSAALLLLALVTALVLPAPAEAATYKVSIKGTVICDSSSDAVQGVWVANANGSSGWARWWAYPSRTNAGYYAITVTANRADPSIRLDIGCGRASTGKWRRTLLTPDFRTRNGYTENRRCIGTKTAAERARVCAPSPAGKSERSNSALKGQCTWGVKEKWKAWTGHYPQLVGNASNYDDDAKRKGFYVSSVPHVGSIVVYNDGSSYGHVGWVTAVRKTKSKVFYDSVDMNYGAWVDESKSVTTGFNKFTTRTNLAWNPSVQAFIVAPT
jgi:surface antigen